MLIDPYYFSPFTVFKLIHCEDQIVSYQNKGWLGDKNKGWFKFLFVEQISGDIMICKPIEEITGILILQPDFVKENITDIFAFKLCNN